MSRSPLGIARLVTLLSVPALIAGCRQSPPDAPPAAPAAQSEFDDFEDDEMPDTILVDVTGRSAARETTVRVVRHELMPCGPGTGEVAVVTVDPSQHAPQDTVRLNAGGHLLAIPVSSVRSIAHFRLEDVEKRRHLRVKTQVSPGNALRDSVFLSLDYGTCEYQGDPAQLGMARLVFGIPAEDVGGSHPPGTTLIRAGRLRLSDYTLFMP